MYSFFSKTFGNRNVERKRSTGSEEERSRNRSKNATKRMRPNRSSDRRSPSSSMSPPKVDDESHRRKSTTTTATMTTTKIKKYAKNPFLEEGGVEETSPIRRKKDIQIQTLPRKRKPVRRDESREGAPEDSPSTGPSATSTYLTPRTSVNTKNTPSPRLSTSPSARSTAPSTPRSTSPSSAFPMSSGSDAAPSTLLAVPKLTRNLKARHPRSLSSHSSRSSKSPGLSPLRSGSSGGSGKFKTGVAESGVSDGGVSCEESDGGRRGVGGESDGKVTGGESDGGGGWTRKESDGGGGESDASANELGQEITDSWTRIPPTPITEDEQELASGAEEGVNGTNDHTIREFINRMESIEAEVSRAMASITKTNTTTRTSSADGHRSSVASKSTRSKSARSYGADSAEVTTDDNGTDASQRGAISTDDKVSRKKLSQSRRSGVKDAAEVEKEAPRENSAPSPPRSPSPSPRSAASGNRVSSSRRTKLAETPPPLPEITNDADATGLVSNVSERGRGAKEDNKKRERSKRRVDDLDAGAKSTRSNGVAKTRGAEFSGSDNAGSSNELPSHDDRHRHSHSSSGKSRQSASNEEESLLVKTRKKSPYKREPVDSVEPKPEKVASRKDDPRKSQKKPLSRDSDSFEDSDTMNPEKPSNFHNTEEFPIKISKTSIAKKESASQKNVESLNEKPKKLSSRKEERIENDSVQSQKAPHSHDPPFFSCEDLSEKTSKELTAKEVSFNDYPTTTSVKGPEKESTSRESKEFPTKNPKKSSTKEEKYAMEKKSKLSSQKESISQQIHDFSFDSPKQQHSQESDSSNNEDYLNKTPKKPTHRKESVSHDRKDSSRTTPTKLGFPNESKSPTLRMSDSHQERRESPSPSFRKSNSKNERNDPSLTISDSDQEQQNSPTPTARKSVSKDPQDLSSTINRMSDSHQERRETARKKYQDSSSPTRRITDSQQERRNTTPPTLRKTKVQKEPRDSPSPTLRKSDSKERRDSSLSIIKLSDSHHERRETASTTFRRSKVPRDSPSPTSQMSDSRQEQKDSSSPTLRKSDSRQEGRDTASPTLRKSKTEKEPRDSLSPTIRKSNQNRPRDSSSPTMIFSDSHPERQNSPSPTRRKSDYHNERKYSKSPTTSRSDIDKEHKDSPSHIMRKSVSHKNSKDASFSDSQQNLNDYATLTHKEPRDSPSSVLQKSEFYNEHKDSQSRPQRKSDTIKEPRDSPSPSFRKYDAHKDPQDSNSSITKKSDAHQEPGKCPSPTIIEPDIHKESKDSLSVNKKSVSERKPKYSPSPTGRKSFKETNDSSSLTLKISDSDKEVREFPARTSRKSDSYKEPRDSISPTNRKSSKDLRESPPPILRKSNSRKDPRDSPSLNLRNSDSDKVPKDDRSPAKKKSSKDLRDSSSRAIRKSRRELEDSPPPISRKSDSHRDPRDSSSPKPQKHDSYKEPKDSPSLNLRNSDSEKVPTDSTSPANRKSSKDLRDSSSRAIRKSRKEPEDSPPPNSRKSDYHKDTRDSLSPTSRKSFSERVPKDSPSLTMRKSSKELKDSPTEMNSLKKPRDSQTPQSKKSDSCKESRDSPSLTKKQSSSRREDSPSAIKNKSTNLNKTTDQNEDSLITKKRASSKISASRIKKMSASPGEIDSASSEVAEPASPSSLATSLPVSGTPGEELSSLLTKKSSFPVNKECPGVFIVNNTSLNVYAFLERMNGEVATLDEAEKRIRGLEGLKAAGTKLDSVFLGAKSKADGSRAVESIVADLRSSGGKDPEEKELFSKVAAFGGVGLEYGGGVKDDDKAVVADEVVIAKDVNVADKVFADDDVVLRVKKEPANLPRKEQQLLPQRRPGSQPELQQHGLRTRDQRLQPGRRQEQLIHSLSSQHHPQQHHQQHGRPHLSPNPSQRRNELGCRVRSGSASGCCSRSGNGSASRISMTEEEIHCEGSDNKSSNKSDSTPRRRTRSISYSRPESASLSRAWSPFPPRPTSAASPTTLTTTTPTTNTSTSSSPPPRVLVEEIVHVYSDEEDGDDIDDEERKRRAAERKKRKKKKKNVVKTGCHCPGSPARPRHLINTFPSTSSQPRAEGADPMAPGPEDVVGEGGGGSFDAQVPSSSNRAPPPNEDLDALATGPEGVVRNGIGDVGDARLQMAENRAAPPREDLGPVAGGREGFVGGERRGSGGGSGGGGGRGGSGGGGRVGGGGRGSGGSSALEAAFALRGSDAELMGEKVAIFGQRRGDLVATTEADEMSRRFNRQCASAVSEAVAGKERERQTAFSFGQELGSSSAIGTEADKSSNRGRASRMNEALAEREGERQSVTFFGQEFGGAPNDGTEMDLSTNRQRASSINEAQRKTEGERHSTVTFGQSLGSASAKGTETDNSSKRERASSINEALAATERERQSAVLFSQRHGSASANGAEIGGSFIRETAHSVAEGQRMLSTPSPSVKQEIVADITPLGAPLEKATFSIEDWQKASQIFSQYFGESGTEEREGLHLESVEALSNSEDATLLGGYYLIPDRYSGQLPVVDLRPLDLSKFDEIKNGEKFELSSNYEKDVGENKPRTVDESTSMDPILCSELYSSEGEQNERKTKAELSRARNSGGKSANQAGRLSSESEGSTKIHEDSKGMLSNMICTAYSAQRGSKMDEALNFNTAKHKRSHPQSSMVQAVNRISPPEDAQNLCSDFATQRLTSTSLESSRNQAVKPMSLSESELMMDPIQNISGGICTVYSTGMGESRNKCVKFGQSFDVKTMTMVEESKITLQRINELDEAELEMAPGELYASSNDDFGGMDHESADAVRSLGENESQKESRERFDDSVYAEAAFRKSTRHATIEFSENESGEGSERVESPTESCKCEIAAYVKGSEDEREELENEWRKDCKFSEGVDQEINISWAKNESQAELQAFNETGVLEIRELEESFQIPQSELKEEADLGTAAGMPQGARSVVNVSPRHESLAKVEKGASMDGGAALPQSDDDVIRRNTFSSRRASIKSETRDNPEIDRALEVPADTGIIDESQAINAHSHQPAVVAEASLFEGGSSVNESTDELRRHRFSQNAASIRSLKQNDPETDAASDLPTHSGYAEGLGNFANLNQRKALLASEDEASEYDVQILTMESTDDRVQHIFLENRTGKMYRAEGITLDSSVDDEILYEEEMVELEEKSANEARRITKTLASGESSEGFQAPRTTVCTTYASGKGKSANEGDESVRSAEMDPGATSLAHETIEERLSEGREDDGIEGGKDVGRVDEAFDRQDDLGNDKSGGKNLHKYNDMSAVETDTTGNQAEKITEDESCCCEEDDFGDSANQQEAPTDGCLAACDCSAKQNAEAEASLNKVADQGRQESFVGVAPIEAKSATLAQDSYPTYVIAETEIYSPVERRSTQAIQAVDEVVSYPLGSPATDDSSTDTGSQLLEASIETGSVSDSFQESKQKNVSQFETESSAATTTTAGGRPKFCTPFTASTATPSKGSPKSSARKSTAPSAEDDAAEETEGAKGGCKCETVTYVKDDGRKPEVRERERNADCACGGETCRPSGNGSHTSIGASQAEFVSCCCEENAKKKSPGRMSGGEALERSSALEQSVGDVAKRSEDKKFKSSKDSKKLETSEGCRCLMEDGMVDQGSLAPSQASKVKFSSYQEVPDSETCAGCEVVTQATDDTGRASQSKKSSALKDTAADDADFESCGCDTVPEISGDTEKASMAEKSSVPPRDAVEAEDMGGCGCETAVPEAKPGSLKSSVPRKSGPPPQVIASDFVSCECDETDRAGGKGGSVKSQKVSVPVEAPPSVGGGCGCEITKDRKESKKPSMGPKVSAPPEQPAAASSVGGCGCETAGIDRRSKKPSMPPKVSIRPEPATSSSIGCGCEMAGIERESKKVSVRPEQPSAASSAISCGCEAAGNLRESKKPSMAPKVSAPREQPAAASVAGCGCETAGIERNSKKPSMPVKVSAPREVETAQSAMETCGCEMSPIQREVKKPSMAAKASVPHGDETAAAEKDGCICEAKECLAEEPKKPSMAAKTSTPVREETASTGVAGCGCETAMTKTETQAKKPSVAAKTSIPKKEENRAMDMEGCHCENAAARMRAEAARKAAQAQKANSLKGSIANVEGCGCEDTAAAPRDMGQAKKASQPQKMSSLKGSVVDVEGCGCAEWASSAEEKKRPLAETRKTSKAQKTSVPKEATVRLDEDGGCPCEVATFIKEDAPRPKDEAEEAAHAKPKKYSKSQKAGSVQEKGQRFSQINGCPCDLEAQGKQSEPRKSSAKNKPSVPQERSGPMAEYGGCPCELAADEDRGSRKSSRLKKSSVPQEKGGKISETGGCPCELTSSEKGTPAGQPQRKSKAQKTSVPSEKADKVSAGHGCPCEIESYEEKGDGGGAVPAPSKTCEAECSDTCGTGGRSKASSVKEMKQSTKAPCTTYGAEKQQPANKIDACCCEVAMPSTKRSTGEKKPQMVPSAGYETPKKSQAEAFGGCACEVASRKSARSSEKGTKKSSKAPSAKSTAGEDDIEIIEDCGCEIASQASKRSNATGQLRTSSKPQKVSAERGTRFEEDEGCPCEIGSPDDEPVHCQAACAEICGSQEIGKASAPKGSQRSSRTPRLMAGEAQAMPETCPCDEEQVDAPKGSGASRTAGKCVQSCGEKCALDDIESGKTSLAKGSSAGDRRSKSARTDQGKTEEGDALTEECNCAVEARKSRGVEGSTRLCNAPCADDCGALVKGDEDLKMKTQVVSDPSASEEKASVMSGRKTSQAQKKSVNDEMSQLVAANTGCPCEIATYEKDDGTGPHRSIVCEVECSDECGMKENAGAAAVGGRKTSKAQKKSVPDELSQKYAEDSACPCEIATYEKDDGTGPHRSMVCEVECSDECGMKQKPADSGKKSLKAKKYSTPEEEATVEKGDMAFIAAQESRKKSSKYERQSLAEEEAAVSKGDMAYVAAPDAKKKSSKSEKHSVPQEKSSFSTRDAAFVALPDFPKKSLTSDKKFTPKQEKTSGIQRDTDAVDKPKEKTRKSTKSETKSTADERAKSVGGKRTTTVPAGQICTLYGTTKKKTEPSQTEEEVEFMPEDESKIEGSRRVSDKKRSTSQKASSVRDVTADTCPCEKQAVQCTAPSGKSDKCVATCTESCALEKVESEQPSRIVSIIPETDQERKSRISKKSKASQESAETLPDGLGCACETKGPGDKKRKVLNCKCQAATAKGKKPNCRCGEGRGSSLTEDETAKESMKISGERSGVSSRISEKRSEAKSQSGSITVDTSKGPSVGTKGPSGDRTSSRPGSRKSGAGDSGRGTPTDKKRSSKPSKPIETETIEEESDDGGVGGPVTWLAAGLGILAVGFLALKTITSQVFPPSPHCGCGHTPEMPSEGAGDGVCQAASDIGSRSEFNVPVRRFPVKILRIDGPEDAPQSSNEEFARVIIGPSRD